MRLFVVSFWLFCFYIPLFSMAATLVKEETACSNENTWGPFYYKLPEEIVKMFTLLGHTFGNDVDRCPKSLKQLAIHAVHRYNREGKIPLPTTAELREQVLHLIKKDYNMFELLKDPEYKPKTIKLKSMPFWRLSHDGKFLCGCNEEKTDLYSLTAFDDDGRPILIGSFDGYLVAITIDSHYMLLRKKVGVIIFDLMAKEIFIDNDLFDEATDYLELRADGTSCIYRGRKTREDYHLHLSVIKACKDDSYVFSRCGLGARLNFFPWFRYIEKLYPQSEKAFSEYYDELKSLCSMNKLSELDMSCLLLSDQNRHESLVHGICSLTEVFDDTMPQHSSNGYFFGISSDGLCVVIAQPKSDFIVIFDLSKPYLEGACRLFRLPSPHQPSQLESIFSIAVHPDHTYALFVVASGETPKNFCAYLNSSSIQSNNCDLRYFGKSWSIKIYDTSYGKINKLPKVHLVMPYCNIVLFDLRTGDYYLLKEMQWTGYTGFSHDGTRIFVWGADDDWIVWDISEVTQVKSAIKRAEQPFISAAARK